MSVRKIVEQVLPPAMTKEIWSENYNKLLPVSVQDFDLAAVLPAVFYMFRFGHRRGKGKFVEAFGPPNGTPHQRKRATTVKAVATKLADGGDGAFRGFNGDLERAILADLLLCYCLDNVGNRLGRTRRVQRVAPTHYMSSWVDLPNAVAHLRYVPETIVAMLARQDKSEYVSPEGNSKKTWFRVGGEIRDNLLLLPFAAGVKQGKLKGDFGADRFDEADLVGIDQLLMIRLADRLGRAPEKVKGKFGRISNQKPIASLAAHEFSDDIRRYVRSYARLMPRQAFVESLESCLAIGLTMIVASSVEIVLEWAETGEVPKGEQQRPRGFFVDCSQGVDRRLRALAEQSMEEYLVRARLFPIGLMALRILDYKARYDRKIKSEVDVHSLPYPYADKWLRLLGDLLQERHSRSDAILDWAEEQSDVLAEHLEADYPEAASLLRGDAVEPNPVWRLAEGLTHLRGNRAHKHVANMVDSALHADRPNGLAAKRRSRRKIGGAATPRSTVLRSLRLTDPVLDYLVHLHLVKPGGGTGPQALSLEDFLGIIQDRYRMFVDESPPGMSLSNDLLRLNRATLDRRLRELGLLSSVNDAEAMKRLRPRFRLSRA